MSQAKILAYIETAKQEGAKLETGGKRWGTEGFFVEPTVFSNVTDTMKIAREEVGENLFWNYELQNKSSPISHCRFLAQSNQSLNSRPSKK